VINLDQLVSRIKTPSEKPEFAMVNYLLMSMSAVMVSSQRPGPGGQGNTCAEGQEGALLTLACDAGGIITAVPFGFYGQSTASGSGCTTTTKGSCGEDVTSEMVKACIGQPMCTVKCGHNDPTCCTQGVGSCCGCAFANAKTSLPFQSLKDPCPNMAKTQLYKVACNNSAPPPATELIVTTLKVNSLPSPITIDDPRPHFSWHVDGGSVRHVLASAYEIEVREASSGAVVWVSGVIAGNRTAYIP
jgi:hypothetical protein